MLSTMNAVPFDATTDARIARLGQAVLAGRDIARDDARWLFALCRFDYGPEGTKPTMVSSAPLSKPSFHRYEDYGRLIFEGPPR